MTEFFIRFEGGPMDGDHTAVGPWPPPEVWPEPFAGGQYVSKTMSDLTDEQADHPNIMRGAVYEWRPEEPK